MKATPNFDLTDAAFISSYGRNQVDDRFVAEATKYLEASPVSQLGGLMTQILAALKGADPRQLTRPMGVLGRMIGRDVVLTSTVSVSRDQLEYLLGQADPVAKALETFLSRIDGVMASFSEGVLSMRVQLEQGRHFLDSNPTAGLPVAGEQFDNPRERFSRRVNNLATLVTTHDLTAYQLRLAKSQALDMFDRYTEIRDVLVPVWRQHQLALANQAQLDPEGTAKAIEAHQAMQTAVADALRGLTGSNGR